MEGEIEGKAGQRVKLMGRYQLRDFHCLLGVEVIKPLCSVLDHIGWQKQP